MVDQASNGRAISNLALDSNVLQVDFSPCGDYVLVLSEEKVTSCIRLSVVCTNVWMVGGGTHANTQVVAEVSLRGSDPSKLKPSKVLYQFEYVNSRLGG